MEYYVNYCVNMDKRGSTGKPTVVKTPVDPIEFSEDDLVVLSLTVIENGVETEIATGKLWNEFVRLEHEEKTLKP